MSQMTTDYNYDDLQYDELIGEDNPFANSIAEDYADSPAYPNTSTRYISSEPDCQNSQPNPRGIPIRSPVNSGIGHRTVDSGLSSMVTPASILESPRGGRNIPIQRQNPGSYSGPSHFGQNSTTSNLKRSFVDGYENDESKRWKTEGSENEPRVILAQAVRHNSASHFPMSETLPTYGARNFREESSKNGAVSLGGNGLASANRSTENGLARCQPIGQQVRADQCFTHSAEVNEVSPTNNSLATTDVNKYFTDQHNPSTVMETSELREKCSPQTSSALQGVLRRHTDNQVIQGGQKSSPPININGSAGAEVSIEEDKRRRQQEKNRQYAKDSRDRKNERLKKLEQKTKEQEAEVEILKKVITHYYVKLHKSEPVWKENVREWFTNQRGNSQTRIEVTSYLPDDEEMLKELGNSPYGSVISPVKSRQPDIKAEIPDVIEITDDSEKLPPSALVYSNGEASNSGVKMSPEKGPRVIPPRKSLFGSRSYDRDSRENRPEMSFLDEAENGVDIVKDAKLLEEHRQEESYSLGLFSGSRTEVTQQRIMTDSPWNVTFADQRADVAEEVQVPTVVEDVECVTMTLDQFQEGLNNNIINLGSMDIFENDGDIFLQGDQTVLDVM